MIRRPPRSTPSNSSAASDVYKRQGEQSTKGNNPFKLFYIDRTYNYIAERNYPVDGNEINLSEICKTYNPPYKISTNVYDYIKEHINEWVEEAIRIRNQYPK